MPGRLPVQQQTGAARGRGAGPGFRAREQIGPGTTVAAGLPSWNASGAKALPLRRGGRDGLSLQALTITHPAQSHWRGTCPVSSTGELHRFRDPGILHFKRERDGAPVAVRATEAYVPGVPLPCQVSEPACIVGVHE